MTFEVMNQFHNITKVALNQVPQQVMAPRALRRQMTLTIKPGTPLAELGITRRQMAEFRAAFNMIDKNGDGSITMAELDQIMRSLEQFARTEELQEMIREVDSDGDGTVSFEEFVMIMSNMGSSQAEDDEKELRDAFRVFDKHNRGFICASDLRAVLQCLGEDLTEEEIEDMIKEVDIDEDGRIDFNEFVQALGKPDDEESEDEFLQNEK